MTFAFYDDPGLTTLTTAINVSLAADGSSAPVDRVVYLGSPGGSNKLVSESNPGVNSIVVYFDYSTLSPGTIVLSSSLAGLSTDPPGYALIIGTQILPGQANAYAIYMRLHFDPQPIGINSTLTLSTYPVSETPV